jgi:undecaprenyl diphosphate synthase
MAGERDLTAPAPPAHVAIIMDGNGRWAKSRGLPRIAGHRRGAESVRRAITASVELGVSYLTLFGFSSENWKRPTDEVNDLMGLLRHYLRGEIAELHKQGVRMKVIGDRARLAPDIVTLIDNAETLTRDNKRLTLIVALSYGGRDDIVQAARKLAEDVAAGRIQAKDIDETRLSSSLFTAGIPDPDLLIRTSGEQRISNFLLWQLAYTELVFTETLWPDFGRDDLEKAISDYHGRERRFGASAGSG